MNLIEQIRADRDRPQVKAKSADKWEVQASPYPGFANVIGPASKIGIVTTATDLNGEDYVARHADARRIARVPDMEAALLAADRLAEAAELFADGRSLTIKGLVDALAAYRKATQ